MSLFTRCTSTMHFTWKRSLLVNCAIFFAPSGRSSGRLDWLLNAVYLHLKCHLRRTIFQFKVSVSCRALVMICAIFLHWKFRENFKNYTKTRNSFSKSLHRQCRHCDLANWQPTCNKCTEFHWLCPENNIPSKSLILTETFACRRSNIYTNLPGLNWLQFNVALLMTLGHCGCANVKYCRPYISLAEHNKLLHSRLIGITTQTNRARRSFFSWFLWKITISKMIGIQ